jgi:EAL domain-containing protein (putative c-di-GMP-specific phosphodiesterase class I)
MRKVHAFLDRCGFLVAIDEFGAGYSDISQVSEGHVDLLKIDKSFIQELDRKLPAMRAALLGPMIAIARSIGADVVAEGIETETQLAQIRRLKIHYGQGFLLSRPLPIDAFRRLAQAEKGKVSATVVNLALP